MLDILIDGNSLGLEQFIEVTRNKQKVKLTEEAVIKVNKSRELVERYVRDNKVEYGITTGFGKFSDVTIKEI